MTRTVPAGLTDSSGRSGSTGATGASRGGSSSGSSGSSSSGSSGSSSSGATDPTDASDASGSNGSSGSSGSSGTSGTGGTGGTGGATDPTDPTDVSDSSGSSGTISTISGSSGSSTSAATDPTDPTDTSDASDLAAPLAGGPSAPAPTRRRQRFERFADIECRDAPLYLTLCRLLAQRPQALAWLDAAEPIQRRPNLLLAALHERVLAGAGASLAAYYPSVGGTRLPDTDLPAALDSLLAQQGPALQSLLATRTTQTNEIGRCAVLWPALSVISERCEGRALALLDFGCSAGLNLGVDHFRYDYGSMHLGAAVSPLTPTIACHALPGAMPPAGPTARIASRLGIDPAPVDLRDEAALRWLRACLWPHDHARRQRIEQAVAIVRSAGWPVRQVDDCLAGIEPWLDSLPADMQPVLFNSWVLTYIEPDTRRRLVGALRTLVQRRGLAWLSAEGPWLKMGPAAPPPPGDAQVSDAELANATQWWLTWPGAQLESQLQPELLARSHAHGRWLAWAGQSRTG